MVWLCPRGQSVLQFKNKQEFTEWKASNNTSANTSMSSKIGNYFIGDPVYLLKPYYLREYSTCSSNAELIFNNMLRSSRNSTECAFDRLKARLGFLIRTIDLQLENVPVAFFS